VASLRAKIINMGVLMLVFTSGLHNQISLAERLFTGRQEANKLTEVGNI
tara:strand:+ start:1675 stop:1821 length:147 start_codon:yes stop_codon:yes gene_type:complete